MTTSFPILDSVAWLEVAAKAATRVKIYSDSWHEGEFACVLGANAADAAQKALRVAETVAEARRVLLFDFRGSLRGFAAHALTSAPRNLLRVNIDLADLDPKDIDGFMAKIEETINASGARVCVVDSLFHLCEWRGKSAGPRFFVLKFREMSRRLGISLLLGATARKRISKNTSPTTEHLPKSTAPFIDAIIEEAPDRSAETNGVQPLERQVGTRHGASARPVSARMSELSEKSELFEPSKKAARPEKLSHRLSNPGLPLR